MRHAMKVRRTRLPHLACLLAGLACRAFAMERQSEEATRNAMHALAADTGGQARRRFRREQGLYVQVYAYNPSRDASGRASLTWQTQLLRDGLAVQTGAVEPIVAGEASGPPVPHTGRVDLHALGPGDYSLEVRVSDRNSGRVATRRVGFRIECRTPALAGRPAPKAGILELPRARERSPSRGRV
jgi:hypothetical protein